MINRETLSKLAADAYEDVLNGKLSHPNPFDAIADAVLPLLLSQAQEIERLRKVLTHVAAYDDELASERLKNTGSYGAFDEPSSVQTAREVLDGDQP